MCFIWGFHENKETKKKYIKSSKNGTVYYVDLYGEKWCCYEPFNILYVKYNQYLIDRNGSVLKISQMNQKGYEYSVYLYSDLQKEELKEKCDWRK